MCISFNYSEVVCLILKISYYLLKNVLYIVFYFVDIVQ